MEQLEHDLNAVRDNTDPSIPKIIRIAAHAALIVLGKYYALLDDCHAYANAISMWLSLSHYRYTYCEAVMVPYRKKPWFEENADWTPESREMVVDWIKEDWKKDYPTPVAFSPATAPPPTVKVHRGPFALVFSPFSVH
jgi:hypothetical protein